jgi:fluoride ion exporter CrcB/FEX
MARTTFSTLSLETVLAPWSVASLAAARSAESIAASSLALALLARV